MKYLSLLLILFYCSIQYVVAQNDADTSYRFTAVYDVEDTEVKNQHRTGTCWSFATTSFIESELIRMGKGSHNISEMFFVRKAYKSKAERYVRLMGKSNFSQGGQAHDVMNSMREHGIMLEDQCSGLTSGDSIHNHSELEKMLTTVLETGRKITRDGMDGRWTMMIDATLDVYLGEVPETFVLEGQSYDAISLQNKLEFNPDDYVELTSYSHHPFYQSFNLEVPDNWSQDFYYNLPLEELMEVMEYALQNGYSFCWDGDVSDKFFSHQKGVAIVPQKGWNTRSKAEKADLLKVPEQEKQVNQNMRQKAFDSFKSTDDHLMHIVGLQKDQNGIKYYRTKNSWGIKSNTYGGYLNMSENYIKLNTVAIMIHKDAIPKHLRTKLNI